MIFPKISKYYPFTKVNLTTKLEKNSVFYTVNSSQQAIACSKLTTETLEQSVKYVKRAETEFPEQEDILEVLFQRCIHR